jgi:hypothetical protein
MLTHLCFGLLFAAISSCIPAQELSVDDILDKIEAVEVNSLTATISSVTKDPELPSTIRLGRIIFRKNSQDKKEAAILFDTRIKRRRREKIKRHYILSGRWMAEIDHDNKQFIKRELVAPGEKDIDPFELDGGRIPLPIGQTKKSVLAKFKVTKVSKPTEGSLSKLENNVIGLQLIPIHKSDLVSIDLFYNPETWLPVGICTVESDNSKRESRLTNVKLNTLSEEDAGLLNIETPNPKEWSIDIRPLVD